MCFLVDRYRHKKCEKVKIWMRRRIRLSTTHKTSGSVLHFHPPPREIIVIMPSSAPSPTLISNNSSSSKIQWVNIANVVAYFVNVIVVFGVQYSDRFPSNADQSEKYQMLLSPAAYAFSIWGIIFPAQAIWTVTQLLPEYRSQEVVVKGVGYNYVIVCVAQAAWSILFAKDYITWSSVAMVSILLPLLMIVWNLSQIDDSTTSTAATRRAPLATDEDDAQEDEDRNGRQPTSSTKIRDYLLFRFPFEIHTAWIMAATLVNLNVDLVAWDVSVNVRYIMAWVSLFVLLGISVSFLLLKGGTTTGNNKYGNSQWIVPTVLAWAAYAVGKELTSPKELITKTYEKQDIDMFKIGAFVAAYSIIAALHVKFIYHKVTEKRNSSSTSNSSSEEDGDAVNEYQPMVDNPANLL